MQLLANEENIKSHVQQFLKEQDHEELEDGQAGQEEDVREAQVEQEVSDDREEKQGDEEDYKKVPKKVNSRKSKATRSPACTDAAATSASGTGTGTGTGCARTRKPGNPPATARP
jgi:hypothetical protein